MKVLKTQERLARLVAILLAAGIPLMVLLARLLPEHAGQVVVVHARMPEQGGFIPGNLTATAGEPLRLRLISDDVLHGFAIGQSDQTQVDLKPGQAQDLTLTFDQPGTYTYYCTRWCGANHWRMRGVIEVLPKAGAQAPAQATAKPPLYLQLGIDIDAPHPAKSVPAERPSAARGQSLGLALPPQYLSPSYFRTHTPVQIWDELRHNPLSKGLSDEQVWDLVASMWAANTTPDRLAQAQKLYAQNCAACHGEGGAGDGVFSDQAAAASTPAAGMVESNRVPPANFTDPTTMLGASPALLHGKITRGGMGTGMPYWGPIFTEDQIWSLVEYLDTFQFNP